MSSTYRDQSQYTTTFPYGKYRGWDLQTIPTDYLMYVLGEHDLRYGLREAVTEELRYREIERASNKNRARSHEKPYVNLPKNVDPDVVAEVVDAGKRALSLRHHPDLGGDVEAMQSVNIAADWLRDHLSEVFETAEARR